MMYFYKFKLNVSAFLAPPTHPPPPPLPPLPPETARANPAFLLLLSMKTNDKGEDLCDIHFYLMTSQQSPCYAATHL